VLYRRYIILVPGFDNLRVYIDLSSRKHCFLVLFFCGRGCGTSFTYRLVGWPVFTNILRQTLTDRIFLEINNTWHSRLRGVTVTIRSRCLEYLPAIIRRMTLGTTRKSLSLSLGLSTLITELDRGPRVWDRVLEIVHRCNYRV